MSAAHDEFHLVQANIAMGLGSREDPVMKGFFDQLESINSMAESAPGFVWRLQSEEGDATSVKVFEDPRLLVNLSVWESVEALYDFVFRSAHKTPLKARRNWFSKMAKPSSVLWWTPKGELPQESDIKSRLSVLEELGPTPAAFTFKRPFDASGNLITR